MNLSERIIHDALEFTNDEPEDGKAVSVSAMIQSMVDNALITVSEGLAALETLHIWTREMSPANMERYIAAHFLTCIMGAEKEATQKPQSKKPMLSLVPNTNNQLAGSEPLN